MAVKKPDELNEASLQEYINDLRAAYDELEEKQNEKETDARQEKMDELSNRIELVQAAIDALEAVE
jgi:hypothetical protein